MFRYDEIVELIDLIRGETMDMVEIGSESYRSEFGAGMAHGQIRAANRFKTLLEEKLHEQQAKEEAFEKEF